MDYEIDILLQADPNDGRCMTRRKLSSLWMFMMDSCELDGRNL